MGYKTREMNVKTTETQAQSNYFCPVLGPCLKLAITSASGNCLMIWLLLLERYYKTSALLRKYGIRGISHIRTSVPFWQHFVSNFIIPFFRVYKEGRQKRKKKTYTNQGLGLPTGELDHLLTRHLAALFRSVRVI